MDVKSWLFPESSEELLKKRLERAEEEAKRAEERLRMARNIAELEARIKQAEEQRRKALEEVRTLRGKARTGLERFVVAGLVLFVIFLLALAAAKSC